MEKPIIESRLLDLKLENSHLRQVIKKLTSELEDANWEKSQIDKDRLVGIRDAVVKYQTNGSIEDVDSVYELILEWTNKLDE